jgi:Zn-dependent peptidase ImmA (M78 family)
MIRKRLDDIEALAFSVLHKSAHLNYPVAVDKIAEIHGIKIMPYTFNDEISGVLVEENNSFTIGLNITHSPKRRRFTIAHELGHYFLQHQRQGVFVDESLMKQNLVIFRDSFSSTGENTQEREANAFAAALLMPRAFIENYLKNYTVDLTEDGDLEKMAAKFDVSTGAMAFRLSNLRIFI